MGSGLRGLMNGIGSTFGVSDGGDFRGKAQTVHVSVSENQSLYPIGAAGAVTRRRREAFVHRW